MIELSFDLEGRRLEDVIFIAGLPGMGHTGKQAVDYLIKVLDGEKVSSIKSPFFNPPAIMTHDGYIEDIKEEVFALYYTDIGKYVFLLFTGSYQPPSPENQHILSHKVIEAVKDIEIKYVITLAATPIEYYTYEPKVYGVATSRDLIDFLSVNGVIPLGGEGVISGMNGLLLGYAKKYGFEGFGLLAETYLTMGRDVIAPLALLKSLRKILKFEVDLGELEKRALEFHKEYIERASSRGRGEGRDLGYIS